MELADLNFIDVHIPHPLGGLQSKWKESNVLLYKLYERKHAFSNVYKLAAAVTTFGCGVAICECSFFALSRILTLLSPHRRLMTHGRQCNLVRLALKKSRTRKIDLDEFVSRFGRKHSTIASIVNG